MTKTKPRTGEPEPDERNLSDVVMEIQAEADELGRLYHKFAETFGVAQLYTVHLPRDVVASATKCLARLLKTTNEIQANAIAAQQLLPYARGDVLEQAGEVVERVERRGE